jgi:hypothetical protein
MFPLSKRWMMVAAFGQGVLFAMALTGALRILCMLLGITLPQNVAGNLFVLTSLIAGGLSAYLYGQSLKPTEPTDSAPRPFADAD